MTEDERPQAAGDRGNGTASGKIFINYRRDDSSGYAGRLFDRLEAEFGTDRVFMDVDSIEPGLDFVSILDEWVAGCDVLLAMIGPRWLEAIDPDGQPRLQDPNDFVRIEIRSALENCKRVIPVLVDDATMPRADQLPEDLRALARRNAAPLTHDRFGADVGKLITSVRTAIAQEVERKRAEEAAAARKRAEEEERRRADEEAAARRRTEEEAERKRAEEKATVRRRTGNLASDLQAEHEQAAHLAHLARLSADEGSVLKRAEEEKTTRCKVKENAAPERSGTNRSSAIRIRGWIKVVVPGIGIAVLAAVLVTSLKDEVSRKVVPSYPEMVVIPGGTFQMGSPKGEGDDDERPRHEVRVEKLAIGKTEVTFDQWDTCVRAGGCSHDPDDEGWGRGDRPVINVSWNDAGEYAAWLSRETGKRYRLPTEAEWEYMARAGTDTRWSFGDGEWALATHAWYRANSTHPVGGRTPNPWGLHDVHGNVWGWVQDCWNDGYEGAPEDGSVWEQGDCSWRVVRGGSWNDGPQFLRSANRGREKPDDRSNNIGFRLAQDI